jgi:hypothetical protein
LIGLDVSTAQIESQLLAHYLGLAIELHVVAHDVIADDAIRGAGCRTGYSWNRGSYDYLCNDDSAYELCQIKNGSQRDGNQRNQNGNAYSFLYNGPATGGDGSWVNYACNCGANNSCNNDWSRPICP